MPGCCRSHASAVAIARGDGLQQVLVPITGRHHPHRHRHPNHPSPARHTGEPAASQPRSARRVADLSRSLMERISMMPGLCGRGLARDSYWPALIRICASLTHGRAIGSPSGDGVAYAGWHVGLRHCFAASAQPLTAASTLPRVVAPAPGDHGRAALSACPAPQQPRSKQCLPIEVAVMSTARTS